MIFLPFSPVFQFNQSASVGRNRKIFTLLEVLIAFFLFCIGLGFLISQFAAASFRVTDGMDSWRYSHELINAAEYALLAAPSADLDSRFLHPDFIVRRKYTDPEFSSGFENPSVGLQLMTLQLTLLRRSDKQVLDSL